MKRTILYLCGLAMLFAGCAKEPELAPAHEETPPRRLASTSQLIRTPVPLRPAGKRET